jgi:hypothetical protein
VRDYKFALSGLSRTRDLHKRQHRSLDPSHLFPPLKLLNRFVCIVFVTHWWMELVVADIVRPSPWWHCHGAMFLCCWQLSLVFCTNKGVGVPRDSFLDMEAAYSWLVSIKSNICTCALSLIHAPGLFLHHALWKGNPVPLGTWLFMLCGWLSPLKTSGNYINHLLCQSVILHFVFIGLVWFSL